MTENKERKKMFALGKKLGMDIDMLREIASEYNGGYKSLRKLTLTQAKKMNAMLQGLANDRRKPADVAYGTYGPAKSKRASVTHPAKRPDGKDWDYKLAGNWSQTDYMFDLVLKLGWTLWGFRAWIKKYFHSDHEQWLNSRQRMQAIEGLKSILKRKHDREMQNA